LEILFISLDATIIWRPPGALNLIIQRIIGQKIIEYIEREIVLQKGISMTLNSCLMFKIVVSCIKKCSFQIIFDAFFDFSKEIK
jgi:hypothetical protein